MSVKTRREYLAIMKERYEQADRKGRSSLLSEMETVIGLHRKSILRLLHSDLQRRARVRQRGYHYGPDVREVVLVVAESLDYVCAERLRPVLVETAQLLAAHHEVQLTPGVLDKLIQISVSSLRRMLHACTPQDSRLFPRSTPRPPNPLTRDVPMRRIPWQESEPGHLEVDLVQHSGPLTAGDFVNTLQMIDVATGWSVRRALLGRSFLVMEDAFRSALATLPFPIRELHPDNGPEFFNYHLLRFLNEHWPDVPLSRSHPYQKNDNRFVEQKNYTLVRAYLGHRRFDTALQTRTMNALYEKMGLYYNLFQPVMRLAEKTFSPTSRDPLHVQRHHDQAQTPFHRLCLSGAISPQDKAELEALHCAINPRQLRREIYDLLARLFQLPGADPDHPEDVFLSLSTWQQWQKGGGQTPR
jgi:hypothetical protein